MQNYILFTGGGEWEDCKQLVEEHFAAMHTMAMEKFFIPVEICNQVELIKSSSSVKDLQIDPP